MYVNVLSSLFNWNFFDEAVQYYSAKLTVQCDIEAILSSNTISDHMGAAQQKKPHMCHNDVHLQSDKVGLQDKLTGPNSAPQCCQWLLSTKLICRTAVVECITFGQDNLLIWMQAPEISKWKTLLFCSNQKILYCCLFVN